MMNCMVCDKPKNKLTPKKSRLMAGMMLVICEECLEGKKEPRFLIILVGRKQGPGKVVDYIKHHRYAGADILAKELIA